MSHADPKESKGQVARLARLYHRKMHAILGASLSVEDLEQEFWMVWHTASQRFDPERGFEFKAFLGVAIRNRVIRLVQQHQRRAPLAAVSFDSEIGEDGITFLDTVEDNAESVENGIIRRQERERILSRIDPRLRKLALLLEDTPPEIEREVEAARAKAAFAASRGVAMREPKELTLTMLASMMGVSRNVRYQMLDDMKEILDGN